MGINCSINNIIDIANSAIASWYYGAGVFGVGIGDEVEIETAVGRREKGTLVEVNPYYTHSYGKFVPEIIMIDKQLREIMGGDK